MDEQAKPSDIDEYREWLANVHKVDIRSETLATHYRSVSARIKLDLESNPFWNGLLRQLPEINDSYALSTGHPLLRDFLLPLDVKTFDSFFSKTFRMNVVRNERWPRPPTEEGWLLPPVWYEQVRDIVRTQLFVRYLDGIEVVLEGLSAFATSQNISCFFQMEAKEQGYYAGHFYFCLPFEIPRMNWDTEIRRIWVEVQIATQLQEVLRELLHTFYERRREQIVQPDERKWQWDFRSNEFAVNYLGHILHYVEGTIVDIRDNERERL